MRPPPFAASSGHEPPAGFARLLPSAGPQGRLILFFERWPRPAVIAATFGLLLLVGLADYVTGYELSFLIFYLLPVSLAAWFVGRRFALLASVLSVAAWLAGDAGAGAIYPNKLIPAWNGVIALGFFFVVIWLLTSLHALLLELETRVRQRTSALTEEMAERERLEREVLEISEREQRRIGHDLHDGLGQHLTGTALACQVLGNELAARSPAQAADAERIVGLIEKAIDLTRGLARGLSPVPIDADGLVDALAELAATTTAQFFFPCEFRCEGRARLPDPGTAMHFYRIAQESISNAVRHGRAGHIEICLDEDAAGAVTMTIADDGVGLPPAAAHRREGQGLRIMAHRARMSNAALEVRRGARGGTVVTCRTLGGPASKQEYD